MKFPGDIVLDICEQKGWTQKALAEKAGWDVEYARKLIRNEIPITNDLAHTLGGLIGVDPKTLLDAEAAYQKILDEQQAAADAKEKKYQELLAAVPIKSRVILSRLWHEPQISVEYSVKGVRVHASSEDFIKAVMAEADLRLRPTGWRKLFNWHFPSKEELQQALLDSLRKVEDEMKQSTASFPP